MNLSYEVVPALNTDCFGNRGFVKSILEYFGDGASCASLIFASEIFSIFLKMFVDCTAFPVLQILVWVTELTKCMMTLL